MRGNISAWAIRQPIPSIVLAAADGGDTYWHRRADGDDPLGMLVFYDAGTVGPTFSSLSFAHLRQDGGLGVTLSLQGHVAAQGYLAWGAGHGPAFGYNFTKFF